MTDAAEMRHEVAGHTLAALAATDVAVTVLVSVPLHVRVGQG